MKNRVLFVITAISASCGLLSSCSDVVDIPASDRLTQDIIWAGDQAVLDQYVIGLYGAVREKSTVYMLSSQFTDCLTDIMKDGDWIQDRRYNRLNVGFQQFTSDDASILSTWGDSYTRIRRFNEFLRDVQTYGSKFSDDFIKVRVAEVRLMRAMQYFYLMRVYGNENDSEERPGGIVLRDKLDGPSGNDKNRQRYAESWDWIISEMSAAAEDLPDRWDDANFTRLNKGCAYAFITRCALYAKRWDDVVNYAEKVEELGYSLDPSFANVFADQKSVENIMTITFLPDGPNHSADAVFRPHGDTPFHNNKVLAYTICPTAELADSYEMADGTPFSWDTFNSNPSAFGGDPFSGREPRFYATILCNDQTWEGRKIESYVGGVDGIQLFEKKGGMTSTCSGYYFRKFITEDDHSWDSHGSSHFDIYIRYAEVLLNKAEALAQKGWTANKTDALKAINDVRARVGLPARDALTLDDFMSLLEQERKVELAGENFRYWDLRRWRKGVERLNGINCHGVKITKNSDDTFSYEECDLDAGDTRMFMERYYSFSLPLTEINNNKGLNNFNNPGW